ncbi:MAG: hypothetical protein AB7O92_33320, partial [Acidimicrobiia bacterium]
SRTDEVQVELDGDRVVLEHPWVRGSISADGETVLHLASHPSALGLAMRLVVAVQAVRSGSLLVDMPAVLTNGGAHLLAGQGMSRAMHRAAAAGRLLVSDCSVLLTRSAGVWYAESISCNRPMPAARRGRIEAIWQLSDSGESTELISKASVVCTIMDHAVVPVRSLEAARAVFDVAASVACAVPSARTFVGGRRKMWDQLDALAAAIGMRAGLLTASDPPADGSIGGKAALAHSFGRVEQPKR